MNRTWRGRAELVCRNIAALHDKRSSAIRTRLGALGRAALPLLHDMREFVREQRAALHSLRPVLAGTEHDVVADGVGPRVHLASRSGSGAIGMDAHLPEVMPEARFHAAARGSVERFGRRPQRFVHCGRRGPACCIDGRCASRTSVFAARAIQCAAHGPLPSKV